MPPSYEAAERHLKTIEEEMVVSPDFEQMYTTQVSNLLENYAAPCNDYERGSRVCWYMPNFAVQNPNKAGKWRLVFDAAARCCETSLNNQLLRDVPRELRATAPSQLGTEDVANKILGLHWKPDRDERRFNTSMNRVPPSRGAHTVSRANEGRSPERGRVHIRPARAAEPLHGPS